METIRIVTTSGKPLVRAHVDDDGTVTYERDDDIIQPLLERVMKEQKMEALAAAKLLNKDGWSNGYIMVDRGKK